MLAPLPETVPPGTYSDAEVPSLSGSLDDALVSELELDAAPLAEERSGRGEGRLLARFAARRGAYPLVDEEERMLRLRLDGLHLVGLGPPRPCTPPAVRRGALRVLWRPRRTGGEGPLLELLADAVDVDVEAIRSGPLWLPRAARPFIYPAALFSAVPDLRFIYNIHNRGLTPRVGREKM